MKFLKTIIAASVIAFSTTNCADLQAFFDGLIPDTSSIVDDLTSGFYSSEGSTSAPVALSYGATYMGQVDGINSSYYSMTDVTYGYSSYTWTVDSMTSDVDLNCYDGSNPFVFTYDSSSHLGGTVADSCTSLTGFAYGYTVYAEVYGFNSGAAYSIIAQ